MYEMHPALFFKTGCYKEFRENFRKYRVPEGLMIVKKEEFLALKQGPLSVSEYRDMFL
jgi:hypothetical protein